MESFGSRVELPSCFSNHSWTVSIQHKSPKCDYSNRALPFNAIFHLLLLFHWSSAPAETFFTFLNSAATAPMSHFSFGEGKTNHFHAFPVRPQTGIFIFIISSFSHTHLITRFPPGGNYIVILSAFEQSGHYAGAELCIRARSADEWPGEAKATSHASESRFLALSRAPGLRPHSGTGNSSVHVHTHTHRPTWEAKNRTALPPTVSQYADTVSMRVRQELGYSALSKTGALTNLSMNLSVHLESLI